jgi:hypothetical protein
MKNHCFQGSRASYFDTFSLSFSGLRSRAHFFTIFVDFGVPRALILELMGSLFDTVFSTLFLNLKTGTKMVPKWVLQSGGLALRLAYLPLSDSPPLTTFPKGNPL